MESRASVLKSGGGPPHSKTLHEVQERAAQTLKWVEAARIDILSAALDHLTLGRAALYEAILAKSEVEQAVAGLRRSGNMDDLPRGLLTHA